MRHIQIGNSGRMTTCHCGSGRDYATCCEPYLTGTAIPETAEALMRSRYTAFAVRNGPYLFDSMHPETAGNVDRAGTNEWIDARQWTGLEVLRTEAGSAEDDHGVVEFIASYTHKDIPHKHHEISTFKKVNGRWFFHSGRSPDIQTFVAEAKIGRNDPCICGSGKKYKKCCGR